MASSNHDSDPPFPAPRKGKGALRRLMAGDSRDHLWAVLDLFDARPALKRTLFIGLPILLVLLGAGAWEYQHWSRANALIIARQWLSAGRLDRAAGAVQEALSADPGVPESWRLASEFAWRKGNRAASLEYAKKAAVVGRYQEDDVLAWAEAAILGDDPDQAQEALDFLDASVAHDAPRALRVSGEIARRAGQFALARNAFQAALRSDTDSGVENLANDEIPLGIVSLAIGSPSDRARGRSLLTKWADNPTWGAEALRNLIRDAMAHGDKKMAAQGAEALSVHPRCTLADIPLCLQALQASDAARYQTMLGVLETKSRSTPIQSAQLMGWLTQIGQGAEAIRWGNSLDPSAVRKPPIAPAMAEALHSMHHWQELRDAADGDWGRDLNYLALAYGMAAAHELGDAAQADILWKSLRTDATLNPAHALFAGDLLIAWGYSDQATELLLIAADQQDLAYQALGTLARLYQVRRDSVGQYKVFSRLNEMRPSDRNIANNYAYYAALTDLGSETHVERIAADNVASDPSNIIYRSTDAFVLVWAGQASRAMEILQPAVREWKKSPAVAFAYGAALASLGRKDEARDVFNSLNPHELSPVEIDWIRTALR
jgi:tetratricopeptide (TPR) repeat protein